MKNASQYTKHMLAVWLLSSFPAVAQGTFQNLNFESATVVPIPGDPFGRIQFDPAFPSWTGTINGVPQSQALYNNLFLSSPGIALLGPGWAGVRIEGNYTAALQASSSSGGSYSSLAQVGTLPSDAHFFQMRIFSGFPNPSSLFAASFAGQNIPLTPIGSGANYVLYGGDISAYAGQNGELSVTALPSPNFSTTVVYLDSIAFTPIPEPGIWALLGLGGALCWCATRWRRK